MESTGTTLLRIGNWCVDPTTNQISRDGESTRLEARTMRLLLCLAEHAGEVVSIDQLLDQVWSGVIVSPDSVYQAVTSLRRQLGDDPKRPTYIATVPRLGYRMVAAVGPWVAETATPVADAAEIRSRTKILGMVSAVILFVLVAGLLVRVTVASRRGPETTAIAATGDANRDAQKSIAVLPFQDLTEGMKEGEFADGMTEELIDKLSKLPGLRVPSPAATFYYRDKNLPLAFIAKELGVVYVLDGSVRKSDQQVRVAARLLRADNGYVIWSETYDRPFHDLVKVQDDIAGEVTKALSASTEFKAR